MHAWSRSQFPPHPRHCPSFLLFFLSLSSDASLSRLNAPSIPIALQALEIHGVGGWKDITAKYLPKWDDNTVRIKTCRLVGCQNLKRYQGWKCTRKDLEEEYEKNHALGQRLGCWKAGMLVDNDQGAVALALKEIEDEKSQKRQKTAA